MKQLLCRFLFFALICICHINLYGSVGQFNPIAKNNIDNSITSLIQDSLGFIWMGTPSGLFRFDGFTYKSFQNREYQSMSMLDTRIRTLYKDNQGDIWIGMDQRATIYDLTGDCFRQFGEELGNRRINTFCQFRTGQIVAGTSEGIAIIDPLSLSSTILSDSLCEGTSHYSYISSDIDSRGNIWLAGDNGFVRVSFSGDKYIVTKWDRKQRPDFIKIDPYNRIWFNDSENIYMVSLPTDGSKKMNLKLIADKAEGKSISFRDGQALIGTAYEGILRYVFAENGDPVYKERLWINRDIKNDLTNFVSKIILDAQGRIWFGTMNGLFLTSDKTENHFNVIDCERGGLAHNVVSDVCEDKYGNVWVSTSNGLNKVTINNGQSPKLEHFTNSSQANIPLFDRHLQAMTIDDDNRLWIGTKRQIVNFDIEKERFFIIPKVNDFISSRNEYYCKTIHKDSNGNIYMGFVSGGIFVWNKSTDSIHQITISDREYLKSRVFSIMTDKSGNLWFDSKQIGLIRIENKDIRFGHIKKYKIYTLANHNNNFKLGSTNAVFCCKDGSILAGTSNGLYRYEPSSDQFVRIQLNFLDDNIYVSSITQDQQGVCWVFSTMGVYRYSPSETDSLPIYTELNNGLFARRDYTNGSCITHDGYIFSSGIGGLTYFRPQEVVLKKQIVPIFVSDFTILNKKIFPDGLHIDNNINLTDNINLYHSDVHFSFEFTTLNYEQPNKTEYCYKLENFDKDWIFIAGGRNFVSYSNLAPGHYILRIKATDSDGMWSDYERKIFITVNGPWWESWWFTTIYILIILSIIAGIVKIIQVRYRYIQNERLNQMNQDFYMNVANGFKTPLTMLQIPLEEIIREGNSMKEQDRNSLLSIMDRSLGRLSGMISQLLEFRRLNQNLISLNLVEADICHFVKQICDSFKSLFDQKNIDLQCWCGNYPIMAVFDPDKIEMVVFNLLHNAYNFTPQDGKVTVICRKDDDGKNIRISVQDTGIGISSENQQKIFLRFWQICDSVGTSSPGMGIGLSISKGLMELHKGRIWVESTLSIGSTFIVSLPVDNIHFKKQYIKREFNEPIEPLYTMKLVEMGKSSKLSEIISDDKPDAEQIAIISSDNDMVRLMQLSLKKYNIIYFPDTETAFSNLIKGNSNLIIVDMASKDKANMENFYRKLKENPLTGHIPVILVTIEDIKEEIVRYYEIGVDSLIERPFNSAFLNALIKQLLQNRRTIHEKAVMDIMINKTIGIHLESADQRLMSSVMSIIEDNLANESFSLADFSDKMGMSRSVLYTKIHTITGQSPMEFIRNLRLDRAASLLISDSFNIMQIGYMVGFSDSRYFSACFKRKFGVAPRKYILNHKANTKN